MACVALLSLMRTLELEFFQPLPRPILQEMELLTPFNKHLVQSLLKKLRFLMQLFNESRMDGVEAMKELETKLRDVAFRVEDEIEFQIAHLHETDEEFGIGTPEAGDTDAQKSSTPSSKLGLILQQGMEDIDAVKEELVKINKEYMLQGSLDVLPISEADPSQPASESHNKMIPTGEEFMIIKYMLIGHPSKQREIVSISGMGGIGKTMLARRIYENPYIAYYFEVRAWVSASKHYNKKQMLLGLLNSIGYANSSTRDEDDEDLALRLRQRLMGLRYLIVIDDVWSIEAWDAFNICFPDDGYGSRVLLTTCLTEVACYATCNDDFFHQMHPLNQSQSWDLFCQKVGISRLANLETIARPVVDKCKGLPLAVVIVAGLFSNLNTLSELEYFAKILISSSTMATIAEACSRILSLHYNHLPYNLKACFLYLGVFPEGKVIYVKDVARLWASEGLIKECENQSLDEVAQRCIHELLDRNLILESKQNYCGRKIRGFKVHDVVHAFCVREAQKENLVHVVPGNNGFNFCQKGSRWLSIQSTDFDDTLFHSASSNTCRSIFIFCFSEVKSLHLKSFNLLRVFYFSDASMCKKIVDLVHLRYLPQVVRDFRIIKLLKAWNLQTLDDGRNKLKKFGQQQDSQSRPSKLALKPCDCTIELFLRSPDLKEVVITGERSCCNECIDTLVFLPQLRGLYINGSVRDYRTPQRISINNQIGRLKGLVELSFQNMNFEWKGIDVLCLLRRLKVLRLLSSGMGKVWELPEDSAFCSLVYLEIFSTDLKHWKASTFNFWSLERLIFRNCFGLRKIPDSFTGIRTLKSIELTRCLPSAVNSVFQIKDEQRYYGRDDLDVIEKETIQPRSDGDESSEDDA